MRTDVLTRSVYVGALLALIAAVAGGAFCNGVFFIGRPYGINYAEGLVVSQATYITDLARAYAPFDHYPFVAVPYPPVYYLATFAIGKFTPDLLVAGRTVSVLSAVLICVVVGWITFRTLPRRAGWQGRLLAAILAGALPTTLYNFSWTWVARVDTLAVLLSLSGVAVFAVRPKSGTAQFLASVLIAAGLFTRQTALAAPLACALVALLIDRRIAVKMLLQIGILGGLVLGLLAFRTHGQVLLHLFFYNQNPFYVSRAVFGLLMNTRHVAALLLLACGASWRILYGIWTRALRGRWELIAANLGANPYRRTVLLLAVYSTLAGLSSLTFGKEASDINYFLEWNISLAPLAGILLFRAMPPAGAIAFARPAWLAALAVPLLLLSAGIDQARDGWRRIWNGPLPTDQEQLDIYRRMMPVIGQTPGEVLSEDEILLYKTGKQIPAELSLVQCLAKAGMWDETPFVNMILARRFGLIVAYDVSFRERYSPAVAQAIDEAYERTATIGDHQIYQPRNGLSKRP